MATWVANAARVDADRPTVDTMSDERPEDSTPRPRSMKPSEVDLEQQIADAQWTMGERAWRDMYGE
jgi:hypothetical protein